MNFKEEFKLFQRLLQVELPGVVIRSAEGASNAPLVLENGFKLGLFNLAKTDFSSIERTKRPFCLATRVAIPPRKLLHVALVFEGDALAALRRRRDQITARIKGNLIRTYVHTSGVYLRQTTKKEGISDPWAIDPLDPSFGSPIPPTAAFFADVENVGRLDPVELAYIDFLGRILEPVPLVRLGATGKTGGIRLDPRDVSIGLIVERIAALGGNYPLPMIRRYHTALNHLPHKHFVLLTGISGTGKTLLAKAYAYAVLGEADLKVDSDDFFLVPVRPDWTDPSHLLGFYDVVTSTYRRTRFLDAVLRASENRDRPVFLCLDEMNLAQPEYYFSDIMSSMESGEDLFLHDFGESTGTPQRVKWPTNLYITGTVNVDETTRPFSPKLLDRANVIDLSSVHLQNFIESLITREPELRNALTAESRNILQRLHDEMAPHSLHFGYRSIEEIARYIMFALSHETPVEDALDIQIEQKLLTKLRGGPEQGPMLTRIKDHLEHYPRSRAVIERMIRDLESYSSFQYW